MRNGITLAIIGLMILLAATTLLQPAAKPRAAQQAMRPSSNAASAQLRNSWMFGHDAQHSGRSPFTGPATPTLKWKYNLGGNGDYSVSWTPLSQAEDGTLYVGADHLYAFNPDGTVKWEFACGAIWSTAAIGEDGTLYFGSDDGKFYALSPEGKQLWSVDAGKDIRSSPAIGSDGTIYASFGGGLRAIRPDGSEKWRFEVGGYALSSPAIGVDGTVSFTSTSKDFESTAVYALNHAGGLLWEYPLDGYFHSPVVGTNGDIYLNGQKLLFAFSSKGQLRWQREINSVNYTDPAVGMDGTLYVGGGNKLQALCPDGEVIWEAPVPDAGGAFSCPTIAKDGTIYMGGGFNNTIYAFKSDGSPLWEYKAGGTVNCTPLIAPDGTLYVADWNHTLFAFAD
jgi:outer membrane protein assembly factor BamB